MPTAPAARGPSLSIPSKTLERDSDDDSSSDESQDSDEEEIDPSWKQMNAMWTTEQSHAFYDFVNEIRRAGKTITAQMIAQRAMKKLVPARIGQRTASALRARVHRIRYGKLDRDGYDPRQRWTREQKKALKEFILSEQREAAAEGSNERLKISELKRRAMEKLVPAVVGWKKRYWLEKQIKKYTQ